MTEQPDKRRHPRYEVEDVRGRLRATLEGEVINLSVRGMALRTRSWLSPGRTYTLKLEAGDRTISLEGTVARCRLAPPRSGSEGETVYEAGIEFEGVVSDAAEEVLRVIEERSTTRLERRAFGRFKLRDEDGLRLETTPEFEVRKVSRSGLLIVSDYVPAPEERIDAEIRLEDRALRAQLRVAYVHRIGRTGDGPRAEIGVEILDMPEEDRSAYVAMIDRMVAEKGQS